MIFRLILLALIGFAHGAETTRVDICVYGGTSGAVAAAVQAKRMNQSVVLVSPDKHLGGMTSGGLGWTDIGDERILGGLSHEFFNQLYEHYNQDAAWNFQPRASYKNQGQGSAAMNHQAKTMSVFEPKVAEAVFEDWIKQSQIEVIRARLDRSAQGMVKDGKSITSVRTEDGRVIQAKIFIDATYEGDLMALAGVSYAIGREANSKYGETLNGIQTGHKGNQLPRGIDPYIIQKDPASGLLPGVNATAGGGNGSGDDRVQAYCYRMCLTNYEPNRVMISKPVGYAEKDYEILFRAIEAGQKDRFFKFSPLANYKTDSNNDSGISTDFIGSNDAYPAADYATRDKIAKAHENWQRGLVWTLQNHPRVPEAIRRNYANWGLPKDEFADNGNWAYALYVREARRMVGDYVVTQKAVANEAPVERSIGMGAYQMDSHHVQKYVTPEGDVQDEGDVQAKIHGPYRIDYGAVLPKKSECDNLLVTFCVSASHIAFGSIRMEPVFMVLSQSAVTAGAIAIERKIAVQDVPYDLLEKRLIADGQRLALPAAIVK
jgi:hypothetical protein